MIDFGFQEAQLFRMLTSFFGHDRVVPKMSILAACGGRLPVSLEDSSGTMHLWAKSNSCLFTIVDFSDTPKLVIEFFSGFGEVVDPEEVARQKQLPDLLKLSGVQYITLSRSEFDEITDPDQPIDFFHFLRDRVEIEEEYETDSSSPENGSMPLMTRRQR